MLFLDTFRFAESAFVARVEVGVSVEGEELGAVAVFCGFWGDEVLGEEVVLGVEVFVHRVYRSALELNRLRNLLLFLTLYQSFFLVR